jgi:archaellum biogenesis protein FlaJ (TadC family)
MRKNRIFIGLGFNLIALIIIFVSIAEGGNKLLYLIFAVLMLIASGCYFTSLLNMRKS